MPAPTFPPEIIASVVKNVDDRPTLELCALAASVFLEPSQRQLYGLLKLRYDKDPQEAARGSDPEYRTYAAAAAHFEAFPHLAKYVSSIHVVLGAIRPVALPAVGAMFLRLQHVRYCELHGSGQPVDWLLEWPIVVAWLSTQTGLKHLAVYNVSKIPRVALRAMLNAALSLELSFGAEVGHPERDANYHPAPPSSKSSVLRRLNVLTCETFETLARSREFAGYFKSLTALTMTADRENRLCFAAADSLQELSLSFPQAPESASLSSSASDSTLDASELPNDSDLATSIRLPGSLPLLRNLRLMIDDFSGPQDGPYLPLTLLSALVGAAPRLGRVTLQLCDIPLSLLADISSASPATRSGIFTSAVGQALDELLLPIGAVVWTPGDFYPDTSDTDPISSFAYAQLIDITVAGLKSSLPRTDAGGRLSMEA
ncbi:hypothetical protein MIND_00386100 [Mycena indigotica]|uniref:Uncharacterized protein n=1 Tax=Mycena indigotica TaxID=2126181 RepID=A0A8H6W9W4_9AGAR|nr:uncharacterized protein MIND_00386100 [Mycena indigotica]KAF7310127.1 hypothetical protein MIND_00386100 [Mycena indigotica]